MGAALPQIFALQEGLLVGHDLAALYAREDPHLVESVLYFFLGEVGQLHLLEGVDLLVGQAFHLKHRRVGSLS